MGGGYNSLLLNNLYDNTADFEGSAATLRMLISLKNHKLMNEKKLYESPATEVLELKSEGIICTSNPGDSPEDLGGGEWI